MQSAPAVLEAPQGVTHKEQLVSETQLNLFADIECVVEDCFGPRQKREYCKPCYRRIYHETGKAPPKFCLECGISIPTFNRSSSCCESCKPLRKQRLRYEHQQRLLKEADESATPCNTIQCRICGQWREKVAPMHIKCHGLTTAEYRALFPDAQLVAPTWGERHASKLRGKPRPGARRTKPRRGAYQSCEWCGAEFYVKPSLIGARKFCSYPCTRKGGDYKAGPDHYMWRGGYKEYYGPNWQRQRKRARKRDNYQCQHCGLTEEEQGSQMDVHHITRFADFGVERYLEANQLTNLECLCHLCHIHETQRGLTGRD